jgi:hypothetical protein
VPPIRDAAAALDRRHIRRPLPGERSAGLEPGAHWLGLAGSVILAASGTATGALPVAGLPAIGTLRDHAGPGLIAAYLGLTLLLVAWWRLGRPGPGRDPAPLRITMALWAAPLLLAPPLFSRDIYSYLAQGAMVVAGIDVYRHGPARLGGPLAAEVPAIWQHTPAPYGPVFLLSAAAVAVAAGSTVALGVVGMRVVALAGVATLAVLVPRLARRCGVDPAGALWLGVLNPLVLIHLVAGAHNDALMLGLLIAGLFAAFANRPVLGAVLVTLAALVKAPAALGLPFVALIWAGQPAGRRRPVRATLLTAAVAVATGTAVTTVAGTGVGWLATLDTPVLPHTWSLTSTLGQATGTVLQAAGVEAAAGAVSLWRWTGLAATAVACVLIWRWRARLGPVYGLGLGLAAVVLLGPAIRPWYLLWGLVPIAAAAPEGPVRRWAPAASAVMAVVILPNGFVPSTTDAGWAVAGATLGLAAIATGRLLIHRRDVAPCGGRRPSGGSRQRSGRHWWWSAWSAPWPASWPRSHCTGSSSTSVSTMARSTGGSATAAGCTSTFVHPRTWDSPIRRSRDWPWPRWRYSADTVSFGQINVLLVALVFADARLLRTGNRSAGVLIGLAAAVKLTPAMFIGYLLLTRRWRAAATAAGTAAGATLLAAVVAPAASRLFWTEALWDTERIGSLSYVSNQSLMGVLARLDPDPPRGAWLLLVAATVAVWAVRAHRIPAAHNDLAGFALTAVAGCLISPITWVHHLVWLIPALVIVFDTGLASTGPRRRRLLAAGGIAYVVLCSSVVWLWYDGAGDVIGFLGSSFYVWIALTLLLTMPTAGIHSRQRIGVPG